MNPFLRVPVKRAEILCSATSPAPTSWADGKRPRSEPPTFNHNENTMTKLTTATRNKIPAGDFALPGRRYPIEDEVHARDALSRVSQDGTPAEKATVRGKVLKRFPGIEQKKTVSK